MSIEVKLPDLGDGIESGDVLEIFVSVGDTIEKGQDIVEMETDKATVTVPASAGGKVVKILISEGDTVAINGCILELEADSTASDSGDGPKSEGVTGGRRARRNGAPTRQQHTLWHAAASPCPCPCPCPCC